ncbi:MAG: DNA mismatch repair protein MutS [Eubacterium sp.]|nr:DNA mismatch repair protein MutS [Eubacterium sp.]
MEIKNVIIESKKAIEEERMKLDKTFSFIAVLRLVSFLAGLVLFFIGIGESKSLFIALGIILLFAFLVLIRFHGVTGEKLQALKVKTEVMDRYLKRISGEWRYFTSDGSEYLDRKDNLSHDLDLLGKNSLFQLSSIAHTGEGRKKLAETLSLKVNHIDEIDKRYDAINELMQKKDFLFDFESYSELILEKKEKERKKQLEIEKLESGELESGEPESGDAGSQVTKEEKSVSNKEAYFAFWMYPLMLIVPIMNIACITMVLMGNVSPSRILVTFIIGLVLTWGPKTILDNIISPVYKYGSVADDYYRMLSLLANMEFDTEMLKNIHDKVTSRHGLLAAVKSLGRIGSFNNISFNPLAHMVLAGFLGWDYIIALLASNWSQKNKNVFEDCLDVVSDIEELGSLAVIPMIRETSKPEIRRDKDMTGGLIMEGIYHPMINPATVISNDSALSESLTIITGSNMSGKTTFLRTIAINMVLGFVGCGVCAKKFSVPYARLFTSMRVMDDVAGGISTFYAEILRIKEMAEYVESDPEIPALCLIDEIFKGTNSADRIVGSQEALKKLSAGNAMIIVTTHDFELCDLKTTSGKNADNYHFEEYYQDDELRFDYKIKSGRCTTRNAMAILKMAGLVHN